MMRDAKNDALLQARFYNEHPTFKTLAAEEQELLKSVLGVLEMTRTDSTKVEGYEGLKLVETDGKLVEYDGGTFAELGNEFQTLAAKMPPSYRPQSPQEKLRARFSDAEDFKSRMADLTAAIQKEAGSNPQKLRELIVRELVLPSGKQPASPERTIAALRLYASVHDFKTILNERALNDLLRAFLEREKRTVDLESFKVFPQAPQFLKLFLQVAFEDVLGLPEEEAARQALQTANIARVRGDASLMDVGYYDEDLDAFRWSVPLRKPVAAAA